MKKRNPAQSTQKLLSKRKNASLQSVVRDDSVIKRVKNYPIYLPNNLDLDNILLNDPIDIPNARDYCAYIIHLIITVPIYSKDSNYDEGEYTILNSTYLQHKIDNYKPLVNYLVKNGIIEVNESYWNGGSSNDGFSKGYKLSSQYLVTTSRNYITTWSLIKKLIRQNKDSKYEPKLLPENLGALSAEELSFAKEGYSRLAENRLYYLKKWFNHELKIDGQRAKEYLIQLFEREMNDKFINFPTLKYIRREIVINELMNQNFRFLVDDTTGRLHTLLTILKSELRSFITYNGHKLVSLDIKNSQPLLSLTFLNYNLYQKNLIAERIRIYNKPSRRISSESLEIFYTILGENIKNGENESDVLNYRKLVISGKLYEYFGKILQVYKVLPQNIEEATLIKLAKKSILKCLFNRNSAIEKDDSQQIFQATFPTVYNIFSSVKHYNHRTLACVLQNLEADLVLHRVCKELTDVKPNECIFTIHDSVTTTEEAANVASIIITKRLKEIIGVEVEAKKDYWDESHMIKNNLSHPQLVTNNQSKIFIPHSYGYVNEDETIISPCYSLSNFIKDNNFKRNLFYSGLRELGIFDKIINQPTSFYKDANIVIPEMKRKFIGKTINITILKLTEKGFNFLEKVTTDFPELFPKNKVKIKRARP